MRQLPRTSRTARAQHGDAALWGDAEHLLAEIADRIAEGNWQYAQANSTRPVRQPKPIPRPGAVAAKTRALPSAAALRDWKRRHGQED